MPYKIEGNKILHFKDGSWSVKQTCKNHANAVKSMRLLQAIEHGTLKSKPGGSPR